MVREEICRLGHTEILYAGTRDPNEGARDLRLNVAMVPRESGAYYRNIGNSFRRLKEEIRIAEEGESRLAHGNARGVQIRLGIHVEQLLRHRIDQRSLQIRH